MFHKLKLKPSIQTTPLSSVECQIVLVIKFVTMSKNEKILIFKKFLTLLKQQKQKTSNQKQPTKKS